MLFFPLIHVKMPTIVGILTFMSGENFLLSCVEHEKSFITSGPGLSVPVHRVIHMSVPVHTEQYILCKKRNLTFFFIFCRLFGSKKSVGWLVGCFEFNGPLRQYFSLYWAVSQREGEREERIDKSKNVQTTPTRTYCKRNRPLLYCNQNCRTPRHWKFTQHHRTTRPPPKKSDMIYKCTDSPLD